jgi:hypothetical protein
MTICVALFHSTWHENSNSLAFLITIIIAIGINICKIQIAQIYKCLKMFDLILISLKFLFPTQAKLNQAWNS